MALPEPERMLTLVIAATGLRIAEVLGAAMAGRGLCQSENQSSPCMGGQQSCGVHEDRAVRSARYVESNVGRGLTVLAPADPLRSTERDTISG